MPWLPQIDGVGQEITVELGKSQHVCILVPSLILTTHVEVVGIVVVPVVVTVAATC